MNNRPNTRTVTVERDFCAADGSPVVVEIVATVMGQYHRATLEDPEEFPEVVDHKAREITTPDGPTIPTQILELFWPSWEEDVLAADESQAEDEDDDEWDDVTEFHREMFEMD